MDPTSTPGKRAVENYLNHERALRRASDVARALDDATKRLEVTAWSSARASDGNSAESIELRTLMRLRDDARILVHSLRALTLAMASHDESERMDAGALSERLERERRACVASAARALESAMSERQVVRDAMEFLEMPGDREMLQRAEEIRERSWSEDSFASAPPTRAATPAALFAADRYDEDDLNSLSEDDAARMYDTFNAYSAPITPRSFVGVAEAYESAVKSNGVDDSPGGISEDSAYGSPKTNAKSSGKPSMKRYSTKSSNGGIWAGIAVGAIAVGTAMRFASTPQCAALQAFLAIKAASAKRGAQAAIAGAATRAMKKLKSALDRPKPSEERVDSIPSPTVNESRRASGAMLGLEAPQNSVKRSFATRPASELRWKPSVVHGHG